MLIIYTSGNQYSKMVEGSWTRLLLSQLLQKEKTTSPLQVQFCKNVFSLFESTHTVSQNGADGVAVSAAPSSEAAF